MSYSPQTKLLYVCGTINSGRPRFHDRQVRRSSPGTRLRAVAGTVTRAWIRRRTRSCGRRSCRFRAARAADCSAPLRACCFTANRDGNADRVRRRQRRRAVEVSDGRGRRCAGVDVRGRRRAIRRDSRRRQQFLSSRVGDNLWAFKLGGKVPPAPAPRPPGPAALPTAVAINPAVLPPYVGAYELQPGSIS